MIKHITYIHLIGCEGVLPVWGGTTPPGLVYDVSLTTQPLLQVVKYCLKPFYLHTRRQVRDAA